MTPATLIELLKTLPQDKSILCQVVPQQPPGAWNMSYEFLDTNTSFIQLRIFHSQLVTLPNIENEHTTK